MVIVCQTCGDRGFYKALVYCDNCQAYAVHRYCLEKVAFGPVVWLCEDCELEITSTLRKAFSATCTQSISEDSTIGKLNNDMKTLKNNKKKVNYDSGSLAITKVQKLSSPFLQPPTIVAKDETQRRSLRVGGPNSEEAAPSNISTSLRGSDWVNIDQKAESVNSRTSLVALNEHLNLIEHNPLDPGNQEPDGVYSDQAAESVQPKTSLVPSSNPLDPGNREPDGVYSDLAAESVQPKTSLVPSSNQMPKHIYFPAQPIFQPTWRGNFCVYDENFVVKVVAHLSSLACLKVWDTAKCLPESLCLELLPRCNMWPKGFKRWGPSEETIALYIFPDNERDTKTFDSLVDKMIVHDLGMRAVVQDVELLVFTSRILPLHFWSFQEKFYLWGVFRAKQASYLTNVVVEGEKNPLNPLTMASRSPVSPLSDSGSSPSG